eukprot:Phypoly_transcript_20117.p1 GENE.Phypoly_transcript_20117~~Phypoly_transcript_20117.p1  ORF type:complete len:130 (+),score=20.99 Phypoly_transcript_20117:265-654(+)
MHIIRQLRESGQGTTATAYHPYLAEDVVLNLPILDHPVVGKEKVAKIMAISPSVRKGKFIREHKLDEHTTFMQWKGEIDGRELESLEVVVENQAGQIIERTVSFRPVNAALIFLEKVRPLFIAEGVIQE